MPQTTGHPKKWENVVEKNKCLETQNLLNKLKIEIFNKLLYLVKNLRQ